LMYRITHDAAPDIMSINPTVPPAVAAVIGKAMCKNVGERYQRGADMAADLRRCMEQTPQESPMNSFEKSPR